MHIFSKSLRIICSGLVGLMCGASILFAAQASAENTHVQPSDALSRSEIIKLISDQVELQPFVESQFVQRRSLKGLSRSLESKGVFFFWNAHGLFWENISPFYRATTYAKNEVIYWSKRGEVASTKSPNIQQQEIAKILLAILAADIDELEGRFNVEPQLLDKLNGPEGDSSDPGKAWKIILTPRQLVAKKFLSQLVITGHSYLSTIEINAANGDQTQIVFQQPVFAQSPSIEQCELFRVEGDLCQ